MYSLLFAFNLIFWHNIVSLIQATGVMTTGLRDKFHFSLVTIWTPRYLAVGVRRVAVPLSEARRNLPIFVLLVNSISSGLLRFTPREWIVIHRCNLRRNLLVISLIVWRNSPNTIVSKFLSWFMLRDIKIITRYFPVNNKFLLVANFVP